jgi:hypothetical protein
VAGLRPLLYLMAAEDETQGSSVEAFANDLAL